MIMRTVSDAFNEALTYDEFVAQWRAHLAIPKKELDKKGRIYQFYALYNQGRTTNVTEAFAPSKAIEAAIGQVKRPMHWFVLTEDWCVDSAFALPMIVKLAALSKHITLKILPRDANLDMMDRYLTDGARSIPKLIAFDPSTGEEVFQWGPRPAGLHKAREAWKADGVEGKELSKRGADWYEEGGWRQVEDELLALLTHAVTPVTAG
ncbi:MAG: hypothetical protein RhofKO_34370 [Rhodothermales bacterium]